jgi:hypothetical protein
VTALTSPQDRRSVRLVRRWVELYLLELDPLIAQERREEIASDLHEHALWAEGRGESTGRIGLAIIGRAVRGAAADVSWRRDVLRAQGTSGPVRSLGLVAVIGAFSSVLAVFGLFVVARSALAILRGGGWITPTPHVLVAAGTALLVLAVALLLRSVRGRVVAALALGVGAVLLLPAAVDVLMNVSVTAGAFISSAPTGPAQTLLVARLLAGGVALIGLSLVLAWWPARHHTKPS